MRARRLPYVSVIIPARDEGKHIIACLRSLLRTNYPNDRWEIIVADGGSTDDTRDVIGRVAAKTPVPIRVVENPRGVTPCGLNAAIRQARGSIIIRVDAHAEYGGDYVGRCVRVLRESLADNVGGPVRTVPGADTTVGRAIALAMAHPLGVGNSAFRIERQAREVDTVPFGCFHIDLFHRLGLFDERLVRHQDYEFNTRIRRSGGHIWLDPRLESVYIARATLSALLRQAWSNGIWNSAAHWLHPETRSLRHMVPAAFTLGTLFALACLIWEAIAGIPWWGRPFAYAAWVCCLFYVGLVNGVAIRLAARHGARLWAPLVAIFPSFHWTYGAGLLWGRLRLLAGLPPWAKDAGIPTWEAHEENEEEPRVAA